jgi:hypothetical protein
MYTPDDFSTATLLSTALIFVAVFAFCVIVWKALEPLRNWRFDRRTAASRKPLEIYEDPAESWACQAISRPSGDCGGDDSGGFAGMSDREQEELFSTYAPRKVRRAMRARRRVRETHRNPFVD